MIAPHTQGRIRYTGYGDIVTVPGNEEIATTYLYSDGKHDKIGRRLAACWNRLEPFTTEQIEDFGYDLFSEQRPQFDRLAAELSATKQQRDELLEAAKQMQAWVSVLLNTLDAELDSFEVEVSNSKTGASVTLSLKEQYDIASAAIAKVGGAA